MRHNSSLLKISLLLLFTTFGFAQDYRARVEGIVTDQSKAVVAGATVTLRNVNTGIQTVHKTSDTGLYLFDLLDPGAYSITVEAPGFGMFKQENIAVQTRGDRCADAARGACHERRGTLTAHMSIPPLTPQIAPVINDD